MPEQRTPLTQDQSDRIGGIMRAIGMKGEFGRIASRELKMTPEYAQARRERRARAWLNAEMADFGEAAYELLQARKDSLEP